MNAEQTRISLLFAYKLLAFHGLEYPLTNAEETRIFLGVPHQFSESFIYNLDKVAYVFHMSQAFFCAHGPVFYETWAERKGRNLLATVSTSGHSEPSYSEGLPRRLQNGSGCELAL